MANFMILEKALQDRNINYEVVAVTDVSDDERPTILRAMALEIIGRLIVFHMALVAASQYLQR